MAGLADQLHLGVVVGTERVIRREKKESLRETVLGLRGLSLVNLTIDIHCDLTRCRGAIQEQCYGQLIR